MSNLIIIDGNSKCYGKDCIDFDPLEDGTLTGDTKYCNHSIECKQSDVYGKGYIADWYEFYNHETKEQAFDYFCTGCYGGTDERKEDKKVS